MIDTYTLLIALRAVSSLRDVTDEGPDATDLVIAENELCNELADRAECGDTVAINWTNR